MIIAMISAGVGIIFRLQTRTCSLRNFDGEIGFPGLSVGVSMTSRSSHMQEAGEVLAKLDHLIVFNPIMDENCEDEIFWKKVEAGVQ